MVIICSNIPTFLYPLLLFPPLPPKCIVWYMNGCLSYFLLFLHISPILPHSAVYHICYLLWSALELAFHNQWRVSRFLKFSLLHSTPEVHNNMPVHGLILALKTNSLLCPVMQALPIYCPPINSHWYSSILPQFEVIHFFLF